MYEQERQQMTFVCTLQVQVHNIHAPNVGRSEGTLLILH